MNKKEIGKLPVWCPISWRHQTACKGRCPLTPKNATKEVPTMARKRMHEIKIRMTDDEYIIYQERLDRAGMSGNDYGISCLLDHNINVIENMPELIRQLKGIGNNINQLARAANAGQSIPPVVGELTKGVDQLWQWLKLVKGAGH